MKKENEILKAKLADLERKGHQHFSRRAGLMLAARRILSGVGAASLSFAMMQDVHCSTVTDKEILLRRLRIASHRTWWWGMEQQLQ